MIWKPHVTVAAVIERDGKFLLVEEKTDEGIRYNQPAGHLEQGESLIEAVVRETLEETAYDFEPESLVGVYHWKNEARDATYLRFAFCGRVNGCNPERPLDDGIIAAHWLAFEELRTLELRSPMVLRCIEDWRAGRRYSPEILTYLPMERAPG